MKLKFFSAENYTYSDREFKVLFYQISHSEMIIRSSKKDAITSEEHNIDIYLGDVRYFELPSRMNGLSFRKPVLEDIEYLNKKTDVSVSEEDVIVLMSNDKTYYVVASVISIMENDLDRMKLPIDIFLHDSNQDI